MSAPWPRHSLWGQCVKVFLRLSHSMAFVSRPCPADTAVDDSPSVPAAELGSPGGRRRFTITRSNLEVRPTHCTLNQEFKLSTTTKGILLAQHLFRPRSMATKTEPRNLAFMVTPMQPVILMSLNPPEKDYLYLSMISFFFFILLAIPALLFSIKTREANFHGDQRTAQINSRLALGFSISSILVGSIMIISSIIVGVLKHEV
ncbi:uncharacterized protein LOC111090112 isoform X1 [Canis lupus familiaris]|uniref:uncharacterized protein LOC111090112 isoform X1 n=2 Tax=Canis lupus familiaris TaxID=9615 RepID=UPI0018F5A198|nr:uncharacterized protein LOC111090112 isoform X1 [Canis lupus familiaris]